MAAMAMPVAIPNTLVGSRLVNPSQTPHSPTSPVEATATQNQFWWKASTRRG